MSHWSELWARYEALREEHNAICLAAQVVALDDGNAERHCSPPLVAPVELTAEQEERIRGIEHESKQIESRLRADPEALEILRIWMVDICGESEQAIIDPETIGEQIEASASAVDSANDPAEAWKGVRPHSVFSGVTPLSRAAADLCESLGLEVTDAGYGGGSWHVGAPCTDDESMRLVIAARERFPKQIAAGLMWVKRIPWSFSKVVRSR